MVAHMLISLALILMIHQGVQASFWSEEMQRRHKEKQIFMGEMLKVYQDSQVVQRNSVLSNPSAVKHWQHLLNNFSYQACVPESLEFAKHFFAVLNKSYPKEISGFAIDVIWAIMQEFLDPLSRNDLNSVATFLKTFESCQTTKKN